MFGKLHSAKFIWFGGNISQAKLCLICAGIAGGGLATSLIARKSLHSDISNTASSLWTGLKKGFPPSEASTKKPAVSAKPFNFSSSFQVVWQVLKTLGENFVESFKKFLTTLKELKDKKGSKSIPDTKGIQLSQNNGKDGQQKTPTGRDFLNGFGIICHFAYRDVFEVELGSAFYLIGGVLVDSGTFQFEGDFNKLIKLPEAIGKNLDGRIREFLKLLYILDRIGESKRKTMQHSSSQGKQSGSSNKIQLKRNNMKWATYGGQGLGYDSTNNQVSK